MLGWIKSDGTGVTIDVADNDNSPTNEIELPSGGSSGQVLSTNGSGTYSWVAQTTDTMQPITISDGTGVTIDVADNDNSSTNEIELPSGGSNGQVLSTNGSGTYSWVNAGVDTDDQNLSLGTITGTMVPVNISDGTGVTINVADNDNSSTNEIQNLSSSVSGTNRTLNISGGGTGTTINVADNDNSSTNEIQNLSSAVSGTNRTINISGGGSGTTINVADNDNSSTNEIELPNGGNNGDILSTNGSGTYTWIAPPSGGGGCSAYGDGTAGNVTISSNTNWSNNPPSNGNYMFNNLTINSGRTLTVPSGTVIYCSGTFTNNGTINVNFGVPRARWGGNPDGGFGATNGLTFGQRIAFEKESFRSMHRFGAKGGANGATGGFTGPDLYGGAGGGTIVILASGGIVNSGTISATGEDGALSSGTQDRPGTGGGGGGLILLASDGNISNTGSINAKGGDGSDAGSSSNSLGGAGGGGGLIHLLCPNANAVGGTLNVNGGAIGSNNGSVDPNSFDSSGPGGAGAGDGGQGGRAFGSIVLAEPGAVGALLRSQIANPCNILD